MKIRLIITSLLFAVSVAFTQDLQHMQDFKKVKKNSYFMQFSSEEEAIRKHSEILDLNDIDTNYTIYDRGNNPIAFSYFKLNPKSNKVLVTFVFRQVDFYEVHFMEIIDKDTYFVDLIDKNGESVQLIYLKPD